MRQPSYRSYVVWRDFSLRGKRIWDTVIEISPQYVTERSGDIHLEFPGSLDKHIQELVPTRYVKQLAGELCSTQFLHSF